MSQQTDSRGAGSAPCGPVVVYFAKVPRPGDVKTRLVPPLTPREAAGLYRAFLGDVVVPIPGARTVVYGWPADSIDEIRALVDPGVEVLPQRGHDLFERMEQCVAELFAAGHGPVVIRNTDSPDLPRERVVEALDRSGPGVVVFGPDCGGGYYLVSLSEPCPELFRDLPEGAATVYARSVERARALGLRVVELARERDVDTFDDLLAMWRDRRRP